MNLSRKEGSPKFFPSNSRRRYLDIVESNTDFSEHTMNISSYSI
jgi:hypothetical protein